MTAFPDLNPAGAYNWTPRDFADMVVTANGAVQKSLPHGELQRTFALPYRLSTRSEAWAQLFEHYKAHKAVTFTFFDFWYLPVTGGAVATAAGATVFTLPAKEVSGLTIYHDGLVASPQPTLGAGTGAEGEDQITYLVAPANGTVITYDADEARTRYTVWYTKAGIKIAHLEADIWSVDVELLEDLTS